MAQQNPKVLDGPLAGEDHLVRLMPGSRISALYQDGETVEPFFCRYGLNAAYRPAQETRGERGRRAWGTARA